MMKKSIFRFSIFGILAILFTVFLAGCESTKLAATVLSTIAEETGHSKVAGAITAGAEAAEVALEEITPENEYYIGRAVAAAVLSNYKVYTDRQIEQYMNKICLAIVLNSDQPELFNGYHVKLLDSDDVNAYATSAGHIFITRGMLKCVPSEDAFAAVIAHEIAHIHLKHSLKAIKTSRWMNVGLSAGVGAAQRESMLAGELSTIVSQITESLVNNGYSQKQEFEADKKALSLMADAGYNPTAMNDLLVMMQKQQAGRKTGFFKTHPTPEKRLANVSKELKSVSMPSDTSSARIARFALINR